MIRGGSGLSLSADSRFRTVVPGCVATVLNLCLEVRYRFTGRASVSSSASAKTPVQSYFRSRFVGLRGPAAGDRLDHATVEDSAARDQGFGCSRVTFRLFMKALLSNRRDDLPIRPQAGHFPARRIDTLDSNF
jgi:hypothetical protein